MQRWFALLGPGLMLAAAAVGVSHLVQSTRVGSDYGFSLGWVVVVIALLKYPAFRFAVDYASATGESLVRAYAAFGPLAKGWLYIAFFVDMFIATAAVALVTAGLLVSVLHLPLPAPPVALGIVVVAALLLANGHYGRAERIVKWLVVLFSLLTVTAAVLALPELGSAGRDVFGQVSLDPSLLLFLIAVTGWMPIPLTGAIFLSMWAAEKRAASGGAFDHRAAVRDLRIGWLLTIVLALCFVVLGTAMLFQVPRPIPANAGAFATELLGIFTAVIGAWAYPLIAVAAIAVMASTLFAMMDVLPRVTSRLVGQAHYHADPHNKNRYNGILLLQVAGVAVVLLALIGEFATFIDFATGTGFLSAPAIAWYNYRAITSATIPPSLRPSRAYVVWHWLGFASLTAFALVFLLQRFGVLPGN